MTLRQEMISNISIKFNLTDLDARLLLMLMTDVFPTGNEDYACTWAKRLKEGTAYDYADSITRDHLSRFYMFYSDSRDVLVDDFLASLKTPIKRN